LMDPHNVYFDPGDSIRLAIVWMDWKDDQGNSMWDHVNGFNHEGRIFYDPMDFIAQARIQLFAETPDIYSNQVRFTVTFYQDVDE
jgi:hypothetical protein